MVGEDRLVLNWLLESPESELVARGVVAIARVPCTLLT